MQVCDLTKYDWVTVTALFRNVPAVVPIIYFRDGKWGVEPALIRCTQETKLVFPFLRGD